MKYTYLVAAMMVVPSWGQAVHPTPGALTPSNVAAAPAAPASAAPTVGSITKPAPGRSALKRLESDFDYALKTADQNSPMDVLGFTRGLYLQGFGAVFTAELDLAQTNILPMFQSTNHTPEQKAQTRERKLKHLELLRQQMRTMVAATAKNLDLGPNDQVVVAVRLLYQGWEDRTGLPEQIVMRRAAQGGEIKVDVQ